MQYIEWNNLLSANLFNTMNAGKEIYLYLTKNEIIQLAKRHFNNEFDEEIWNDFISAIKIGIIGSTGNIIDKAKYAYDKSNISRINSIEIKYPPYITYLIFLVLPLTENIDSSDYRSNNYYGKLNAFLEKNGIKGDIGTNEFSKNTINSLWEHLSFWANDKNKGDLGLFNVILFSNKHWKYVGKVFSQCLLPPKILSRLPELFVSIGLVPNLNYDDNIIFERVKNNRTNIIPNSTLNLLKKDDELSNTIIQTIQRQYKKWTGESHEEFEDGTTIRKKRKYTISPLFLQFKVNTNDEKIKFSYRMHSQNDYPEDLKFGEYENLYEINGWSKTLQFEFKEELELKDNFNKWIAKFPDRDVRLFISAGTFQLSNDFWIETDVLSKTERMYLLCKNDKQALIKEWGKTFGNGNFKQEDFEGLPKKYSLFWFRNPTKGLSEIPHLTIYTEKRIDLVGGLKVNFRTYLNEFLPEVEIVNSDGNEKVYLLHKEKEVKIYLSKKTSLNNRWLLPENILLETDFYFQIENEKFSGNELAYNLISSDNTAIQVDGSMLPKRDCFGRSITTEVSRFCLGSNIINPETQKQLPYIHLFCSTNIAPSTKIYTVSPNAYYGNKFADYLSIKKELKAEDFFKTFEFFYSKEFPENETTANINLTKLKKASLSFYDFIGILDYDYETKNIVLNPPQFIFIPTTHGRRVLLIGARDSALVEKIINLAPKYKLQVEINKQFSANKRLLLPDVITIKSFQEPNDNYGEKSLINFSNELNIKFTPDYYPQVNLHIFSATISEYENILQPIEENDYDWARYIFNPHTLAFDKNEESSFDRTYSLVRYKLNEYTYDFKLWKNNYCYQVDMNWGRFLVLKYFNKNVILFDDKNEKVAIPIELPLPRLLAEAIMLLSGFAPDFKIIDERKYRIYSNIPSIFTSNLFRKLGQTPINTIL